MEYVSANSFSDRRSSQNYYDAQRLSPSSSCGSGFTCGEQYRVMDNKLSELTDRVEMLEENKKYIAEYYSSAKKLVSIHRYVLIILAIVEFAVIGIVAYFFSNKSSLLWPCLTSPYIPSGSWPAHF